jgi:hypothetical protein
LLFWREIEDRDRREQKERMAEMFVTTRDAVSRIVSAAFSKKGGRERPPWYLEPEGGPRKGLAGAELEAATRRLGRLYPGRVFERPN